MTTDVKNIKQNGITSQIGSKLPPNSNEAELSVIGAMILDKNCISEITEILSPECFYSEPNKILYSTMIGMIKNEIAIDIVTLNEELSKTDKLKTVGGIGYLLTILDKVTTTANVEYHARIVYEKYMKRVIINTGNEMVLKGFDETTDAFDTVIDSNLNISKLLEFKDQVNATPDYLVKLHYEYMKKTFKKELNPLNTGIDNLDAISTGFADGDLVIIAARPGMGKTSLALTIFNNNSFQSNKPGLFFSLEMTSIELMNKLISMNYQINTEQIRLGNCSEQQKDKIREFYNKVKESKIYIDDTNGLTCSQIQNRIKNYINKHGIKYVIIDYLSLVNTDFKMNNENERIGTITRTLKNVAKKFKIPILLLSQLSREVEREKDKKPQLWHLRDSGSIEQDADHVIFIYRPEYYKIMQTSDGSTTDGIAQLIEAKHRNGKVGTALCHFDKNFTFFKNLELKYSNEIPRELYEEDDRPPF